MNVIRFLYAANVMHRGEGVVRQDLCFCVFVGSRIYEKLVEVHWAGEDGRWHILPATFQHETGSDGEIWRARAEFQAARDEDASLPGDVSFALHARIAGRDSWDNNGGANHEINADSGLRLAEGISLLHTDFDPRLRPGQDFLPLTIAARPPAPARRMFVRWTTDRWRTSCDTPCFFRRKHWHTAFGSAARNPNRYGTEIWISHLGVAGAFRIDYAIGCETPHGTWWDNNFGLNHVARHPRLKVLTLNLHCNQEDDQNAKLSLIAQALRDLDVDIVCFQEVAEPWNDGAGDWSANTANLIRERTGLPYHVHLDWSHVGFSRYRESCAILSRFPFTRTDSCRVSAGGDPFDIHTRKVVMAQVRASHVGVVNVFCAHLSWWSAGFRDQFERLRRWVDEHRAGDVAATLLCGDFNVPLDSAGYALVTQDGGFVDQYLAGDARPCLDAGSAAPAPLEPGRIDHIFLRRGDRLEAVASRRLFTADVYGRVSDHPGYYVEFEPL